MRIRVHQLNPTVGDLAGNRRLVAQAYARAIADGMDLLVLPELVTCGYPPMDLLERASFRKAVYEVNRELIIATGSTGLVFGTITPNTSGKGKPIYNSALWAVDGGVLAATHKTLLPTYDIFDEWRYFEPAGTNRPVEFRGVRFGVTICEDIWNAENEIIYHIYDRNPAAEAVAQGAQAVLNLSASPFSKAKADLRVGMLRRHARELGVPVFYANQTGANTEIVFDGDSMVVAPDGAVTAAAGFFEAGHGDVEWMPGRAPVALTPNADRPAETEARLFGALTLGLRDYVRKSGFRPDVVLGLSGGIDSALVAALAADALGKEAVLGITMPSAFSSAGSVDDSVVLSRNLGIRIERLSIAPLYDQALATLDPLFAGTPFGVAEENIQSRMRGVLLMAVSNKQGRMLLNTGNKSELAVGYCTLYGDMAGGLSILADVYKTEVYALSRWYNRMQGAALIPDAILEKAPSAELRPDQKDSDSLPEYDILDAILRAYIEEQADLPTIVARGYEPATVARVMGLVDRNEFKRRQAAPGLRMSAKAFGIGRRLPIVQGWKEPGTGG